jgi:hypothetical protein
MRRDQHQPIPGRATERHEFTIEHPLPLAVHEIRFGLHQQAPNVEDRFDRLRQLGADSIGPLFGAR